MRSRSYAVLRSWLGIVAAVVVIGSGAWLAFEYVRARTRRVGREGTCRFVEGARPNRPDDSRDTAAARVRPAACGADASAAYLQHCRRRAAGVTGGVPCVGTMAAASARRLGRCAARCSDAPWREPGPSRSTGRQPLAVPRRCSADHAAGLATRGCTRTRGAGSRCRRRDSRRRGPPTGIGHPGAPGHTVGVSLSAR